MHSAGHPPEDCTDLIDGLSQSAKVLAPNIFDMARMAKKADLGEMSSILNQLMISKDLEPVAVVGCSLGGALALSFAAQFPENVSHVVACDPVGWPLERNLFGWVAEYRKIRKESNRLIQSDKYHNPHSKGMEREMLRNPLGIFRSIKLALTVDIRDDLPNVQAPATLLWGTDDHLVPVESGKQMLTLLPNGKLEVVETPTHYWFYLEPQTFLDRVFSSLRQD